MSLAGTKLNWFSWAHFKHSGPNIQGPNIKKIQYVDNLNFSAICRIFPNFSSTLDCGAPLIFSFIFQIVFWGQNHHKLNFGNMTLVIAKKSEMKQSLYKTFLEGGGK